MGEWSINLKEWADKKSVQVKDVRKQFGFACYASVIKKTPTGTPPDDKAGGRAKANWQIDAPDDPEKPIVISNNLPYMNVLEYGGYGHFEGDKWVPANGPKTKDGWSKQILKLEGQKVEPAGMVGLTVANQENIFKAACEAAGIE